MKLDYLKMLKEIDGLVNNDWGFEMIDCKMMPNAKPFTQKEAEEMSQRLGKIYLISHCITCTACQKKYAVVRKNKRQRENVLKLITEEIVIAQKEGQPTSRLTSLYNKISKTNT